MVVVDDKPKYPITVKYLNESEKITLGNDMEVVTHLEFFDSEDPDEQISVIDVDGRNVVLKVWGLEIKEFYYKK